MAGSGSDCWSNTNNWTGSNISGKENTKCWKYLWGNPETDASGDESDNEKTIYDPCPPGWKVMPRHVWTFSRLDKQNSGYYNEEYGLYFPFTGQRKAAFGGSVLDGIGYANALLQTANVSKEVPYRTGDGGTTETTTGNSYVGAGYNVRCVKE